MLILIFFAFLSGLITIFAPCIWPLIPIVISSSSIGQKYKPAGITLGLMLSFTFFTLATSFLVKLFRFDLSLLKTFAVFMIGALGIIMVIPFLSDRLEAALSKLNHFFGVKQVSEKNGFWGGILTGLALGIIWSPCAGPILGTIVTLTSIQKVSFQIFILTFAYVLGVGIPLFIISYGGNQLISRSRLASKYTRLTHQIFGCIMILMALVIHNDYDKILSTKILDLMPSSYSRTLNKFENNKIVKNKLTKLKEE